MGPSKETDRPMSIPTFRRQGCHQRRALALLLVVATFQCLVQVVDSQRVIASLGTRLKRFHNKSGSKKTGGEYFVQGEEKPSTFESLFQENNVEIGIAGSVLMITIYLLSFCNKTKQQKEEGEFLDNVTSTLLLNSSVRRMLGMCFNCSLIFCFYYLSLVDR
jgi:hypothetical protein